MRLAALALVPVLFLAAPAHADDWDPRTYTCGEFLAAKGTVEALAKGPTALGFMQGFIESRMWTDQTEISSSDNQKYIQIALNA